MRLAAGWWRKVLQVQGWRLFASFTLSAWLLPLAAGPAPIADPDHEVTCVSHDTVQVLQPASSNLASARAAHWLDRHTLLWPGAAPANADSNYKIYAALAGSLRAEPGQAVEGADQTVSLSVSAQPLDAGLAQGLAYLGPGTVLHLSDLDLHRVPRLLQSQLWLVQEDKQGHVIRVSGIQLANVIDDWYATAAESTALGPQIVRTPNRPLQVDIQLWAPTAQKVQLCRYATALSPAQEASLMTWDPHTGVWTARQSAKGWAYYSFIVDVWLPQIGVVRTRVTDPYSISLSANSKRSMWLDLESPALKPPGWDQTQAPDTVRHNTDMLIYELHVRDFSASDRSVPAKHRGKYLAFTHRHSLGMRHLRALAKAGMTDIHLLPIFDFATVPEQSCVTPVVPQAGPDSERQQAVVMATAAQDCFNWGYDPYHFNAPEGSYATDADDGAKRVLELRAMIQALHQAGLRVGMDMVFNHTAAAGVSEHSVLDRIVPGYYQRLNANGEVEHSTCCDNTATEHRMMAKLVRDSMRLWTQAYKIDSFRFDLMGHQPRALMEAVQVDVDRVAGHHVPLLGEGWNFGEIANGARFVQASQLSLNGSGIATFSDRGRDALRGGSAGDGGADLRIHQGYLNGMVDDPNELVSGSDWNATLRTADMVRVALAGSVRSYSLVQHTGQTLPLERIAYGDQPAGYAQEPTEVVNYVENHDNQTLFDINALRLPDGTSVRDRVKVQTLGTALMTLSQGIAYFHAGQDILRSKSLDGNSFDSGDWFNRLDWSYHSNGFGVGAPPAPSNAANYPWLKPALARSGRIRPGPADIRLARDLFRQWLKVRASTALLRLPSSAQIAQRLVFYNTGPQQNPALQVGHLDGHGYPGAHFGELLYLVNVSKSAQSIRLPDQVGKAYVLHPALRSGAYPSVCSLPAGAAGYQPETGVFQIPARCAAVWVTRLEKP